MAAHCEKNVLKEKRNNLNNEQIPEAFKRGANVNFDVLNENVESLGTLYDKLNVLLKINW